MISDEKVIHSRPKIKKINWDLWKSYSPKTKNKLWDCTKTTTGHMDDLQQ